MDRLILIRHGRTEANAKHLYSGSTDIPLSDEGSRLLSEMAASRTYPDIAGCHVYTSGMLRTEQTLKLIYGDVPHDILPAFKEMDFGVFEMHSYDELKDREDYQAWITGDNEANICPGGESGCIMTARVMAGVEALKNIEGDVLVVNHGGPIAAIMSELFASEGKNRYEWQPSGGEGYIIEFSYGQAVSYRKIPV